MLPYARLAKNAGLYADYRFSNNSSAPTVDAASIQNRFSGRIMTGLVWVGDNRAMLSFRVEVGWLGAEYKI
jgi:hypothetical protein